RRCNGLIIDLRDNEGGLDVGSVLAQYLIKTETHARKYQRYVRARSAPRDLIPHLDTWDWSFLDWGTNALNPLFQPQGNAVFYRMTAFDDGSGDEVLKPL